MAKQHVYSADNRSGRMTEKSQYRTRQEDLMQKHQLIRNKFTLNDTSTFIKLFHIFQKTSIMNAGFER